MITTMGANDFFIPYFYKGENPTVEVDIDGFPVNIYSKNDLETLVKLLSQ